MALILLEKEGYESDRQSLVAQTERAQMAVEQLQAENSSLSARVAELEKDNQRLREVLKIYANESRWVAISPSGDERVFTHNGNGYDLAKTVLENSEAAKGER